MSSPDDAGLFALISSGGGPTKFDNVHRAIGARVVEAYQLMLNAARKRAPDFDPREVVAETVADALEVLHDQFNGVAVPYRFDPALAPFDAWLIGMMGGGRTRGVIDTMRKRRHRDKARLALCDSPDVLDDYSQQAQSGSRWNGQPAIGEPAEEFRLDRRDVRELRSFLSPREKLILRLALYKDKKLPVQKLRVIVKSSGFAPEDAHLLMQNALAGGIGATTIQQKQIADILGVSERTVFTLRTKVYEKLRHKYSVGRKAAAS
jgi:RNA polymerase sigma factor (sigma-70 family)